MINRLKRIINILFLLIILTGIIGVSASPILFGNNYSSPSFTQANNPELVGPDKLCVIFGSVLGDFTAGGNPNVDRYSWRVFEKATGREIFSRSGGGTFKDVTINFDNPGEFQVQVVVRRGREEIYRGEKTVNVMQGPKLALGLDYLLCKGSSTVISALDPADSDIDMYTIEWRDGNENLVGTGNELEVTSEGFYTVDLYIPGNDGIQDCLVKGRTFVGPAIDFELIVSENSVCPYSDLTIAPDRNVFGEWSALKAGETERIQFGESRQLELDIAEDLPGHGVYTFFYNVKDELGGNCDSERSVEVTVRQGPVIKSEIIQGADGCDINNGKFIITPQNDLSSFRIREIDFLIDDVPANVPMEFDNLASGTYTVQAVSDGCVVNTVLQIASNVSNNETMFDVKVTGEVCSDDGISDGVIQIISKGEAMSGTYLFINDRTGEEFEDTVIGKNSFDVEVPGGTYFFSFSDLSGCSYPRNASIVVSKKDPIDFALPARIDICGSYELVPSENQNYIFELFYPDGSSEERVGGESFTVEETGEYRIVGRYQDANALACPKMQNFEIRASKEIDYEPVILSQDCYGNTIYRADINGADQDSVIIRWKDSDENIVGRGMTWIPPSIGVFSLEVQARGANTCEVIPYLFVIDQPVFAVEVELEQEFFCADDEIAELFIDTDNDAIQLIEWLYIADNGEQTILEEFADRKRIFTEREGLYEVVVYNSNRCELGRDQLSLEKVRIDIRPEIKESYEFCSDYDYAETIDPGEFESYSWYRGDMLLSTGRRYRPTEVGDYTLIVDTGLDCILTNEFTVTEECGSQFAMPNALLLNNPDKHFYMFFNQYIDNASIQIHNRNGQLIYSCTTLEIDADEPTCFWDGTLNGTQVPVGSYTVTVSYFSQRYDINEKVTRKLLILE